MPQQAKLRAAGETAVSLNRAIGYEQNICLRSTSEKSACSKCVDICPGHAIRLPKSTETAGGTKVTLSKGFCVDCGLCCAVCPTTSLVTLEPTQRYLRQLLKRAAAVAGKNGHVYLTCIETGLAKEDPSVVELPCLGMITWEMWISLILEFPTLAVFLPGDLCAKCKAKAAEDMLVDAVCKAQDIAGVELQLVELRRELDFTDSKGQIPAEREEMFENLGIGDMVRDITKGESNDTLTEEERGNQDMRRTRNRVRKELTVAEGETTPGMKGAEDLVGTLTANRAALLDAVMRFPQIAGRVDLEGVRVKADACTACGKCVEVCPLGAAIPGEDGKVTVTTLICTNCGACAEVCEANCIEAITTNCADLLLNPVEDEE